MEKDNKLISYYKIAEEIEANIKDEAEARSKYYKLLQIIDEEFRPIIEEIIADELNHSEKLRAIAQSYSGIEENED